MSKFSLWILVLLLLLALAGVLWLQAALADCEEERIACMERLADCDQPPPAFTLVIENDSFATFQPTNNQVRGQDDTNKAPRTGFLIQVSDFEGAGHAYDYIDLYADGDSPIQRILRGGDVQWVDIECGPGSQTPLTPEAAKLYRPVPGQPATYNRRLHDQMDVDALIAMTIWNAQQGLQVASEPLMVHNPQVEGWHGRHARFVTTSPESCAVRVWTDLDAATPANTYEAGKIRRIVIDENAPPTEHGGPHSPGWGFGTGG